jgi:hypothetical protein
VDRVIVGLEVIGLFKFVSACLLFKRDSIFQIIIENKVLESLQDIFLRSEGNNLVQNEYMNIVTFILQQQESPIYTYVRTPLDGRYSRARCSRLC